MSVSPQILGLGLTISGLGTILLLLSYRSTWGDAKATLRGEGVISLGSILQYIVGKSIWKIITVAISVVTVIFVAAALIQPDILSYIF